MQIKIATIEDIKSIADIWKGFLDEHDDIVAKRNPQLKDMNLRNDEASAIYEKFLKANIESEDGRVLIAKEDDTIAGYSLGFIKNEIPIFQMKRYGYISDLYVTREFRGRGISTKLMNSMLAWFRDRGLEYASIGFYADNNEARDIYKKWGFFDYKIEARKKI